MSTIYTIKDGDNLTKIAKKFGTTVAAIQKANPTKIKNVNVIKGGDEIVIPVATTSTSKGKDYAAIGKQMEVCLKDIENLASFKKLKTMI